jgi:CTP:molybdopterin cytidylyltransferase MocA
VSQTAWWGIWPLGSCFLATGRSSRWSTMKMCGRVALRYYGAPWIRVTFYGKVVFLPVVVG